MATGRPAGSGRARKAPRLIAGLIPEATGTMSDELRQALTERRGLIEARAAALRGEVPVGAVLIDPAGRVIASDGNRTREHHDPTAHAEIQVIRAACAASTIWRRDSAAPSPSWPPRSTGWNNRSGWHGRRQ